MTTQIKIGTSGWTFSDWRGPFYPAEISDEKLLPFYAQRFPCTEVNFTYYKIPDPHVFEHWVEITPDNFEFTVKFNKATTHQHTNPIEAAEALNDAVAPLIESGKFSGYLGQFPYAFKNEEENRKLLRNLRKTLTDIPIFVEFRHESWLKQPVYDFLRQHQLGYVCVDEPQMKGLLPPQNITTTDMGYVRFHGRNSATWWNSNAGDRYDYSYSKEELGEWVEQLQEMKNRVTKLYIFFNNCHHGQAPLNAQTMQSLFQ